MPVQVYSHRFRRKKAEITRIEDALYDIVEAENPMTVRQVFYRAVSAGLVPKTEDAYEKTVQRLLLRMRKREERPLPWRWIVDSTRLMRKPESHCGLEDFQEVAAEVYRKSVWDDQNVYVEVWCEKDALSGVLYEVTEEWDVPLMISRGFSSYTFIRGAAETITQVRKPTYVYYFGDHDPSGLKIDETIERDLRLYAPKAEIHFKRVAVTEQQITELNLPTRPTKTKNNTHAVGWKGGNSVEVDAIPPNTLRQLARDCIERRIDPRALEMTRLVEELERKTLGSPALKEFLASEQAEHEETVRQRMEEEARQKAPTARAKPRKKR
jgi:hypothetical protein